MANRQTPTPFLAHSPSLVGQGEKIGKNRNESSWVEIRTGRLLTSYYCGLNRLDVGKINFYLLLIKIETGSEK